MRQFTLHRTCRGRDITAQVLMLDQGVHISLYGGDRPHIGAVGILPPEGAPTVTQFPGHREGVVCERWLTALAASDLRPAVIEAGIHYNALDRDGIREVLEVSDKMLEDCLSQTICGTRTSAGPANTKHNSDST